MENCAELRDTIEKAQASGGMILPDGEIVSTDSISTRLNNNVIVLGTSGCGKTRSVVIPNILTANRSMIIADPKGTLYLQYRIYLKHRGFDVMRLDLIEPELSNRYNPLAYLKNGDDILKLAHMIVYSSDGKGTSREDPFWDRASELLLSALIGYLVEMADIGTITSRQLTLHEVISKLELINAEDMECDGTCKLDELITAHDIRYKNIRNKNSWAHRQWIKFRQTPEKTFNCILITTNALLAALDTEGIKRMMSDNEIHLGSIGERPTAVFVETSDTDRSKDLLANIFYSQAMNELCRTADLSPEHRLKVPVCFMLDDFGTNCRIDNFERMISNIRSRNISAMIVLQSLSQLEAGYGASAHTVIDNCDTLLYMGGNDLDTAEYISRRSSKSLKSTLNMPVGTHWQFRRGQVPKFCRTVDLSEYAYRRKSQILNRKLMISSLPKVDSI